MLRGRRLVGMPLATVLALTLAIPAAASASSVAEVKQRGRLVVLTFPHSLSSFMKAAGGSYVGVDYDLMRSFASRLKVQLDVRPVERFEDLIPALRAGNGDVIASSFSITAPRRELVEFSASYFPVLVFVMARKGTTITGPANLAGKTGCVVAGSSQEERMNRLAQGADRLRKHYVQSSGECWPAVAKGVADFTLLDSTAALAHMDEYPDVVRAFDLPDAESYGFAVVQGSDLRIELDSFIAEARRSGFLYQVVKRHFGEKGAELFRLVK